MFFDDELVKEQLELAVTNEDLSTLFSAGPIELRVDEIIVDGASIEKATEEFLNG